jgi:hypothetical protein
MPLPPPGWDAVTQRDLALALGRFFNPQDPRVRLLLTAPERYKQEVIVLGLQALAAGEDFQNVVRIRTRFLATDGTRAVAAEMTQPAQGLPGKITSLSEGPRAMEGVQAMRDMRATPDVLKWDLNLTAVRIPGLYIEAYWLRSLAPDAPDIVWPSVSMNDQLQKGASLARADFLRIVQSLAQERLKYDDTPKLD